MPGQVSTGARGRHGLTLGSKMTEYKVVQNAGISLTKGADVTLEVFYTEMYKNQYTVIDGSLYRALTPRN